MRSICLTLTRVCAGLLVVFGGASTATAQDSSIPAAADLSATAGASAAAATAAAAEASSQAGQSPPAGPPPAPPTPPTTPTGIARWFDLTSAPFIPVPEIDTSPHEGLTLGIIPTVLHTNEQGEIEQIIAPDIIHSQYFGWGTRGRIFGYPSKDTQWFVVGGLKERVEREFDAMYADDQLRNSRYTWSVETIYDRSGIPRFFGLGNQSRRLNETSYVNNQGRLQGLFGLNFTHSLQLAYVAQWRLVDVLPGVLPELPSIETLFPNVKGVGTERAFDQRLMLSYDTRDSLTMPRQGARYVLYSGFVSRALASTVSYTYFGTELQQYWPVSNTLTIAWHAGLRYMPSAGNAPFWALSSLGGERSVLAESEPLRSFGDDRFIDRNLFGTGVELRTRVADFDTFGTKLRLEIAPFLDLGKVFSRMGESPVTHLHHSAGIGFRGIASPFIVGYVDIGFGREKSAVFTGLNYPF